LVQQFMTPELGFTLIPSGVQRFKLWYEINPSAADIQTYVTIELADSSGTGYGTVVLSSPVKIQYNDSEPIEIDVDLVFPTTVINSTDRMIVKLYLNNLDGVSRTVVWNTENGYYSYVITSVGVVAGSSGTSGTSGTGGGSGGGGITQITGVTLASGSWSVSSSLYIYDYSNSGITTASSVMVIPNNSSVSVVVAAQILPQTDSASGSVRLYSTYQPSANIGATINITQIV
jgi:hypothetical protein